MELIDCLSDAELDELDIFLQAEHLPDDAMDLAMLDGFLTAIVIGPNTLPASQWLPRVWGESATQTVSWESPKQMSHISSLIFRHMNAIITVLERDPSAYEPLLYEREHDGELHTIIDEWCSGFVQGMELDAAGWQPLTLSAEQQTLLMPILLYGSEAGATELINNAELQAQHDTFADMLPACVVGIRDYWLPQRKRATTVRHEQAAPGRNDPCSCGSGKKYKKCCAKAA